MLCAWLAAPRQLLRPCSVLLHACPQPGPFSIHKRIRPPRSGTAMVTLADGKYGGGDAKQGVLGDLLCLFSAVIYGAYTVSIR